MTAGAASRGGQPFCFDAECAPGSRGLASARVIAARRRSAPCNLCDTESGDDNADDAEAPSAPRRTAAVPALDHVGEWRECRNGGDDLERRAYNIESIEKLAGICVACGEKVQAAVKLLSNMDNAAAIMKICEEIDKLESEADRVERAAMAKLFRDEPDVRQVIKLRAIYMLLETVTDTCEDVANIIEGIVLENS